MRFLLILLLPFATSFVEPETDGRSYFSVTMSSILELHLKTHPKEMSFTISPAALQKTLAILYNSAEDSDDLLDIMLMEMGLKYYDAMRLMEAAMQEMTVFDALKEDRFEKMDKPIKRTVALDYFKNDFNELGANIHYSTLITTPKDLQLSTDFVKFGKDFFNASVFPANDQRVTEFYRKNEMDATKTPSNTLNLYNQITFQATWKPNFIETTDELTTRGHFRYGEIENSENSHMGVRVLELPLQAEIPLTVLIITPKHGIDLTWSTNYEVVRPLTDPSTISNVLSEHLVEVKLPKTFSFETKTDLIGYLRKNGITRAKIYEAPQQFQRLFDGTPKNGISLGKFWQSVQLKIDAKISKELPAHYGGFLNALKDKFMDLTQTETFDVTEKPYLFMLKSNEVIYFMGHYYGKFKQ